MFKRIRPRGWSTLGVLAIGAVVSTLSYNASVDDGDPAVPPAATVYVLQPQGGAENTLTKFAADYDQESRQMRIEVCASRDVMLLLDEEEAEIPTSAYLHLGSLGDSSLSPPAKMLQVATRVGNLGRPVLIRSRDLSGSGNCGVVTVRDSWMARSLNGRSVVRIPSLLVCGWSHNGQHAFDFGTKGSWKVPKQSSACDGDMSINLAPHGMVVNEAPPPTVSDAPRAGRFTARTYYGADSVIRLEDSLETGQAGRDRFKYGISLGVGLTFLAEGLLGILAIAIEPEERARALF